MAHHLPPEMAVRAIGGLFVWALESVMLALLGISTILVTQTFGGKLLAGDLWVMLVILISCIVNVAMQTIVAMSAKQGTIMLKSSGDIDPNELETTQLGIGYLHKSVAQAHCCLVSLMLFMYIVVMQESLLDLNWANAYYTAAPGLVWFTGSITLAFLTVLWITSIAGAWTATAVGDYNSLFCTLPTTCMACVIYPIVHEVGHSGLMVCTTTFVSTLALLYVNLAIASSFTLSILDHVEFDPANILPKFMRTVGDRMPFFRIYSLIHGISVSIALLVYAAFAKNINWVVVGVLLSMNVFMTVTTSIGAGRFLVPSLRHTDEQNDSLVVDNVIGVDTPTAPEQVGDTLSARHITMLRLDEGGRRRLRVIGDPNRY
jgi:hypothetical protein